MRVEHPRATRVSAANGAKTEPQLRFVDAGLRLGQLIAAFDAAPQHLGILQGRVHGVAGGGNLIRARQLDHQSGPRGRAGDRALHVHLGEVGPVVCGSVHVAQEVRPGGRRARGPANPLRRERPSV